MTYGMTNDVPMGGGPRPVDARPSTSTNSKVFFWMI